MLVFTPTVRGAGRFMRGFPDPEGRFLAVASTFPLLTNPPPRAAYGGQRLRQRLALYRRGEPAPFAWFDDLGLPINDVAFHPTAPVVAIGAGSYDGGWMFEGDLVFWDWVANRAWRPLAQTPEVARCAFDPSGQRLEALVRPWDEEWGSAEHPAEAFERFYPLTVPYSPATASTADPDPTACVVLDDPETDAAEQTAREQQLADWFGVSEIVRRGAIWDVAWLEDGRLAAVHDDCLLEVHDLASGEVKRFHGGDAGVAILRASPPIVHVAPPGHAYATPTRTRLVAFEDDTLIERHMFEGAYAFSTSTAGLALGRLDRNRGVGVQSDLLVDLATGRIHQLDLGHYDCFNHYLGVDGASDLYCLQSTPPSSYEHKWLCRVRLDGEVDRLWPLLKDDGSHASHAMECLGHAVEDALGKGVIVAGKHHAPNPSEPFAGFIYRKPLDADREIWRHRTTASASAMAYLSDAGLVVAAFLDGELSLFDALTGVVVATGRVTIDGAPTVIFAMDAQGDRLAFGTFDGRITVHSAQVLIQSGVTGGLIELG